MYELLLLVALVVGLGLGTYYVAQSPAFWVGLAKHVVKETIPIVTRRMPPALEAEWRKCMLRGGKWNDRKKRCE